MATFFDFNQASEGALSVSATALREDAPIGTFSSNANAHEPSFFANGITSFGPGDNVYILHNCGAAQGANQRNCIVSFPASTPPTTFSRVSLDIQHNAGSPGPVNPITIVFEASPSSDFANANTLGTLDVTTGDPEHHLLPFAYPASGAVFFRLRCTSPIPDGSNYVCYANVSMTSYSDAEIRDKRMRRWHKYFIGGLQFALTFTDRDHASLSVIRQDSGDPDMPPAYLSSGSGFGNTGVALGSCNAFSFEAVDPHDYTRGYRIVNDGNYVGPQGVYVCYDCLSCIRDVNQALIFLPEFLDALTFVVRNVADGQVLTRPWDSYSPSVNGPSLGARPAVVLAQLHNTPYAAAQQTFQMPAWALRTVQMTNLPADLHVLLNSSGGSLYATGDQVALGTPPQSDAAVVCFIAPELASIHVGYVISIGGKYMKMTAPDVAVALTSNLAEATHICVNTAADGTLSFWMCESSLVLTTKNSLPVFTLLDDLQAVVPTWQVCDPGEHHYQTTATQDLPNSTRTLADTTYIKAIVQQLRNGPTFSKKGSLWNYSFNNSLPPNWLIFTPERCFDPYTTLEMRVPDPGANDFNLKACDGAGPDPTHPCVSLASSVNTPGGTPLSLHAGHSRSIYEEMYKLIISGRKFIDIASLLRKGATPSGEFLAAVRNAITMLSKTEDAKNVVIRLIFGEPLGWVGDAGVLPGTGPYRSAPELLRDLVRDVPRDGDSQLQVYLAYTSSAFSLTWNHAKMIAVDGQRALVGGHNMWDGAYLGSNPVLDVSMRTEGLSAVDAHHFAENLWFAQVVSHGDYWAADAASYSRGLFAEGQASIPPPRLFASILPSDYARSWSTFWNRHSDALRGTRRRDGGVQCAQ